MLWRACNSKIFFCGKSHAWALERAWRAFRRSDPLREHGQQVLKVLLCKQLWVFPPKTVLLLCLLLLKFMRRKEKFFGPSLPQNSSLPLENSKITPEFSAFSSFLRSKNWISRVDIYFTSQKILRPNNDELSPEKILPTRKKFNWEKGALPTWKGIFSLFTAKKVDGPPRKK